MEKEQLIALVRQGQSGDSKAIEKLLQYAHTSVSYQCRKMLKHAEDAEDMTQEVLVTIYTKLDSLQEPAAFHKWVNQITASRCINALNRTHVEYQFAEDEEGHSILDNLEELDEQMIPDKAIDNKETTRMIEEIVGNLPDAQRAATVMFYYSEMSVKKIAETMKVSENTVKSRLNYARKAIKDQVLEYEKQGIKLYGLSPLPFLLYFLRLAAKNSADKDAAGAMAAKVMAAEGTAAVIAAGAEGAAATAAAGGAAATGSTVTAGIFAGFSAKVAAGILAAVVAVGSFVAVTVPNIQGSTESSTPPIESTSVTTPEAEVPTTEDATQPAESEATEAPTDAGTGTDETEATEPSTEPAATTPTQPAGSTENTETADQAICTACGVGQIIPVNLTQDPCATTFEVAFQCDHCGNIAGYSYPPGNGHTYGISEDGQYEICTICGTVLGPTNIGHGGVTETSPPSEPSESETDPQCQHEYKKSFHAATIYSSGYTTYTCIHCGYSFNVDFRDPPPEQEDDTIIIVGG